MHRRFLLPLLALPAALIACPRQEGGGGSVTAAPPAVATPTQANPAPPTLFEHMVEHYASLTWARDAIVRGDLATADHELTWVAGHTPSPDLPPAAQELVAEMQIEAAAIVAATTPGDAARALSRTAVTCGRCHGAMGVQLKLADAPLNEAPGVPAHMQRHRWILDRLWEGLVAPSDEAWKAGATRMMAEASVPEDAVPHAAQRDAAVDVMARFVQQAGQAALESTSEVDRARVFGDLVAGCADCHAETGRAATP